MLKKEITCAVQTSKVLFALVSMLLAAACAKENPVQPQPEDACGGVTVFKADVPSTKTALQDDLRVFWTNGDQINVNGAESNSLELETASATATFTIPHILSSPYKAVFPASIYKDGQTVTLPAVQSYAENSFGTSDNPMAAYQASGNNLTFKHLCAVFKLNLAKGDDADKILYVEFSGKNDEQVNGDFSIDYEDARLSGVSSAVSAKKVHVNVNQEIPESGLCVYIAVPAGSYSNGYTFRIVDAEGHYMEKSKSSSHTLDAGTIYNMTSFSFVPTGSDFNVGITTAGEFIAYCKSGNVAAGNVAALLNDIEFTAEDCANFASIGTLAGTLKGNHHTISGFNTGKPVISSAASTARVENLTVSGSATIASIPASGADGAFGTICSYNNGGSFVNCHSAVNYTFGEMVWSTTAQLKIGGVVGDNRNNGAITDGVNSGNLDFTEAFDLSGHSTSNNLRIGGVVAVNVSGTIDNAEMSGNLHFSGVAGTQKLNIGGIAGENSSNMIRCKTSGSTEIVNDSNASDRRVAGLCCENTGTISDCTNAGEVLLGGPDLGSTSSSYHIGGLIARNNSTSVSGLTNKGPVTIELSNTAAIKAFLRAGGCIGLCQTALAGAGTIRNEGDVVWNSVNGFTGRSGNYGCELGGIIGMSQGNVSGCINSGNVILNEATKDAVGSYLNMGGIVGYATNTVTVSGCTNSGSVDFNPTAAEGDATGTRQYKYICLGGIVGRNVAKLTLSGCTCNGTVDGGLRTYNNNQANCYYGGIIGYLCGNASSVANCNVRNSVINRTYNNAFDNLSYAVFCGGVAGYAVGGTGDNKITLSSCNVVKENGAAVTVQSLRGRTGGIAGYAENVDISGCTVNVYSHYAHQCYGGICAQMKAASADGCDVRVDHLSSFDHYAGGLVGMIDGASAVDDCTVRCSLSYESGNGNRILGILAGYVSATGSEISNCQYAGTLLGAASETLVGSCKDGTSITLTDNTPLSE